MNTRLIELLLNVSRELHQGRWYLLVGPVIILLPQGSPKKGDRLPAQAGEVWVMPLNPTTGVAEPTVCLLASAFTEPMADLLWRWDSWDLGWPMQGSGPQLNFLLGCWDR